MKSQDAHLHRPVRSWPGQCGRNLRGKHWMPRRFPVLGEDYHPLWGELLRSQVAQMILQSLPLPKVPAHWVEGNDRRMWENQPLPRCRFLVGDRLAVDRCQIPFLLAGQGFLVREKGQNLFLSIASHCRHCSPPAGRRLLGFGWCQKRCPSPERLRLARRQCRQANRNRRLPLPWSHLQSVAIHLGPRRPKPLPGPGPRIGWERVEDASAEGWSVGLMAARMGRYRRSSRVEAPRPRRPENPGPSLFQQIHIQNQS